MTVPVRAELPRVERFVTDKDPSYYGRYRLWFDQVSPTVDTYRALIKVRAGATAALAATIDTLDPNRQNWPIQLINRGKHAHGYSLDPGPPEEDLLSLELLSDVCYIDMRNFRWAMERLAPHVEAAHFFVLSTGDGLDRWADEYRLADGAVTSVERWLWEPDLWRARIDLYQALSKQRRDDAHFREFVRICRNKLKR